MARKPRIHVPGGVYHVMLRGNGGQEIFLDPGDGARFLELVAEGAGRFGFRCHGYCLMPNHVHLVLQAGAAPLGDLAARSGRDPSSLSRALRRVADTAAAGGDLQERMDAVKNAIMQA